MHYLFFSPSLPCCFLLGLHCSQTEKGGQGQIALPNKSKKKQAKVELDRLKQAEKKKRRLEKALATSAAIRSELEKKKQKKLEEEQRLDEEGAAVAESVALYVLLEDSQDPHRFVMTNTKSCGPWICARNVDLMSYDQSTKLSGSCADDACAYNSMWNDWNYEEMGQDAAGISAVRLAAQAVSSLQIVEDIHKEPVSSQR